MDYIDHYDKIYGIRRLFFDKQLIQLYCRLDTQ
jgi:hypothetical protein